MYPAMSANQTAASRRLMDSDASVDMIGCDEEDGSDKGVRCMIDPTFSWIAIRGSCAYTAVTMMLVSSFVPVTSRERHYGGYSPRPHFRLFVAWQAGVLSN